MAQRDRSLTDLVGVGRLGRQGGGRQVVVNRTQVGVLTTPAVTAGQVGHRCSSLQLNI